MDRIFLRGLFLGFFASALVACVPLPTAAPPPAARAQPLPAITTPTVLARVFVEASRRRDSEWLAALVHPASAESYRRVSPDETRSYEAIWLSGRVPAGRVESMPSTFVSATPGRQNRASYRAGDLLFVYPVRPSHNLLITVRAVGAEPVIVANHAIRRDNGRWYIVLPAETRRLGEGAAGP